MLLFCFSNVGKKTQFNVLIFLDPRASSDAEDPSCPTEHG